MPIFDIRIGQLNTENEHTEVVATQVLRNDFVVSVRCPFFFGEHLDGSWRERVVDRIETYKECECTYIKCCDLHVALAVYWAGIDEDALDSWRESRGDLDAMLRRTERKIKQQGELEPDE